MAGKSKGIVIGILIVFVLKLLMYAFKITTKVLAHIIVYFGLYIPFFYCIFGLVLYGAFGLNFDSLNTNTMLFFSGLGLSLLCSLIITLRNLVVRPIKSVFAYSEDYRPTYREEERRYYERHIAEPSKRYYNQASQERRKEDADGYIKREYRESDPRMPIIYYSEREPELLIYEYDDRFEVFIDNGSQPKRYLRTEYK